MKKIKVLIMTLFFLSLFACSAEKEIKEEKVPEVKNKTVVTREKYRFNELESWMNLMPGGKDSFHLSGDLIITSETEIALDKAGIKHVSVFQQGKKLIEFVPNSIKGDVSGEDAVYFQFSTNKGLQMTELFNSSLPINVEVLVTDGKNEFTVLVDNLTVEKIY